jgi:hypothetical protein
MGTPGGDASDGWLRKYLSWEREELKGDVSDREVGHRRLGIAY